MSLVPMVRVPLNIMCSKRWLIPVMPGALVHGADVRHPARHDGRRVMALEEQPAHAVGERELLDVDLRLLRRRRRMGQGAEKQQEGKAAGRDHVHVIELQ